MNIKDFLKRFEGEDLEFRSKFRNDEDRDRDIRVITSFYNGRGGVLLFGISEDGSNRRIVGVDMEPQTIESNLTNKIRGKCSPEMRPKISIHLMEEDKYVIEVKCPRGKLPPYRANKKIYIRRNSSSFEATEEEIADLYKQRDPEFDKQVLENTGIIDLDMERLRNVIEKRENKQIFNNDFEKLLIRNNLAINENDVFHLTMAGILLFGKNPQNFLPQAKILVQVNTAQDPNNWKYINQFEGNIFDQIESVETFFRSNLKMSAKIIGFERREELEIPIQALREATINAIVHRDYHNIKSDIQISISSTNLRIISPGGLVAPLTMKEIDKGTFIPTTRNPAIAGILLTNGLMDKRGTGIQRMKNLIRESGLSEPLIREITEGSAFEVVFTRREPEELIKLKSRILLPSEITNNLNDVERKILLLIEKDKEVKPSMIEKEIKLSRPKMNKILKLLVDRQILKRYSKSYRDPHAKYILHPRFGLSALKKQVVDKSEKPLFHSLFDDLK